MPTIRRRVLLGAGLAAAAGARALGAAKPAPVALGALFPFSGSLSLLGDESFRGLDLATDECNAAGGLFGHPVALVRGDAAESATGAAEARRLVEKARVGCIFGTYAAGVAIAASAVTELAGIPYFELDALADSVTERGLKLIFRTGPTAGACGRLAVDTVADLLAPAWQVQPAQLRLAILHEDGPTGTAIATAQEARCKERQMPQAERIPYPSDAIDLVPLARRLHAAGADVVLHTGHANDVVQFHRALKQIGWRPRMVIGAGGGYSLNDTAQALGAEFEGVMNVDVTQYRISPVVAPGVAGVAATYQRKYGAPPRSGHSLVCFAGARVFYAAMRRAGTLDHAKLRAAVLATDWPPGSLVGGWGVAFDETGQNRRAVAYLSQWRKGVLLTVAPLTAAVAPPATRMGV